MQIHITFASAIALFSAMAVLALIPSMSVLAVTARSATSGFIHGVSTTIGIIIGDIIFILLAIFGLTVLAETMGDLFDLIKYVGGAYLIFLGINLWRTKSMTVKTKETNKSSLLASFLAGLLITLGDQKAILFYLGFFPAFLDLARLSYFDTIIIITIATVAIGSVKLGYAYTASRASLTIDSSINQTINIVAGSVMVFVGVFLITMT